MTLPPVPQLATAQVDRLSLEQQQENAKTRYRGSWHGGPRVLRRRRRRSLPHPFSFYPSPPQRHCHQGGAAGQGDGLPRKGARVAAGQAGRSAEYVWKGGPGRPAGCGRRAAAGGLPPALAASMRCLRVLPSARIPLPTTPQATRCPSQGRLAPETRARAPTRGRRPTRSPACTTPARLSSTRGETERGTRRKQGGGPEPSRGQRADAVAALPFVPCCSDTSTGPVVPRRRRTSLTSFWRCPAARLVSGGRSSSSPHPLLPPLLACGLPHASSPP